MLTGIKRCLSPKAPPQSQDVVGSCYVWPIKRPSVAIVTVKEEKMGTRQLIHRPDSGLVDRNCSFQILRHYLRVLLLDPPPPHPGLPVKEHLYIVETLGEEEEQPGVERRRS